MNGSIPLKTLDNSNQVSSELNMDGNLGFAAIVPFQSSESRKLGLRWIKASVD